MTGRTMRRGIRRLGAPLLAAVSLLAFAPAAPAVQTDQYDPFTACPTDNPTLNDPASGLALCAAGSGQGQLKIGDRTLQLGRIGVQFASSALGAEEPACPQQGLCFGQVPGTTTVEDDPSVFSVGSKNPWSRWSKGKSRGKGKGLRLSIAIESAGDVSAFSPGFLFEFPLPLYRLPIKFHVEAPWLDDDCYVGSDEQPIILNPSVAGPPASFEFLGDPNGFPVEQFTFAGVPLVDKQLAIPRARGCGHGHGPHSDAKANAFVDWLLGLPSAAGLNEMVLPDTDLSLVGAGFDEVPPDGGAALRAAFEAAG
jgi:hypothetical protein